MLFRSVSAIQRLLQVIVWPLDIELLVAPGVDLVLSHSSAVVTATEVVGAALLVNTCIMMVFILVQSAKFRWCWMEIRFAMG